MQLRLVRVLQGEKSGTVGMLYVDLENPICCTLELPFKDNQRNISCIPAGVYSCSKVNHARFGETLLVNNVPSRSGIFFHTGNRLKDIRGCILPGFSWVKIDGEYAVFKSRQAMQKFRAVIRGSNEITLRVEDLPCSENH